MTMTSDILVLDKDENPIGLFTKLELNLDATKEMIGCKLYFYSVDNPKATLIEDHTVNRIYGNEDADGQIIIKLN